MRLGPINLTWGSPAPLDGAKAAEGLTIDQVIMARDQLFKSAAGISITPENCMQSPTIVAIVTAISRRISTLPIQVLRKTESGGQAKKEPQPNHPVAKLLASPNDWQDSNQFWLDGTSQLVRWGNFFCIKSRGTTGPIRQLLPLNPGQVNVRQEPDWNVIYETSTPSGEFQQLSPGQILHARGPARDSLKGDSVVHDIREAIALEIQAERMGAAVFGNTALPSIIFKFAEGAQGYKNEEDRNKFVQGWQDVYSKHGRFTAALLPKGIEVDNSAAIDNEKAQYVLTRQYQRTVIAAAFGVPVHMVGDLSKGTFNNVEQQTLDFVINVVLPYARMFECAMEKALLTQDDRNGGIIIRFNLDAILRGDFKSRQDGLNIMRQAGVISANDWRQHEDLNPIKPSDGGNEYWRQGPSGQGATPPGSKPPTPSDTTDTGDDNADANAQP